MFVSGVFICLFILGSNAEHYIIPLFGLNVTSDASNADLTLIILSDYDTFVYIKGTVVNTTISPRTVNVTGGYRNTVTLTGLPFLASSRVSNESLLVQSSVDVSIQAITRYAGYREGFKVLPTTALGNEYYADTFCALGGYCQVTIATTVSGTTKVYLRLPSSVDEEIMFCRTSTYWKSGRDKVITLEYPDTIQITSRRDLTGSYIYTDNPVSVLAGAHSIQNGSSVYHTVEHLVPTGHWGASFSFKTIGNESYGNVVGIIAKNDSTIVTMNGYQDTMMAAGQFIKRRVELGAINYVNCSESVQLTLFTSIASIEVNSTASTLTAIDPGMSLVPALEHAKESTTVACLNTGDTTAMVQLHSQVSPTMSNFVIESDDRLPYTNIDVIQMQPTTGVQDSPYYLSASGGILLCEGTALMPLVEMTLETGSTTCVPDIEGMIPGDGIDNNCGGAIDEDYCFEHKMVNDSLFFTADGLNEPHSEDVSGFRKIKIKISSLCHISNIELRDENNETVFIQITLQSISAHALFNTNNLVFIRQNLTTYDLDCGRIYPFWLLQTSSQVCFDLGPVVPADCTGTQIAFSTAVPMLSMRIGASYANVTYWIDLQRDDCLGLHSSWRCGDIAPDCADYGTEICTSHMTWSQIFCGVYCGFCIPDSYGEAFVLTLPATTDEACVKTISVFPKQPQMGDSHATIGIGLTNKDDMINTMTFVNETMQTSTGDSYNYTAIGFTGNVVDGSTIYVYAEEDVRVTVDFKCPNGPNLMFPVEPLDIAGTEYMTSFFQTSVTCHILVHDGETVLKKLRPEGETIIGTISADTIAIMNLDDTETTGTIIQSDKPVTVFCGNVDTEPTWQQLLPTKTWGQRYVVAATNDTIVQRITLRVITNRLYTVVFLTGDFDMDFTLANRGDYFDQEIQKNVAYTVTANRPISVGVLFQTSTTSLADSSWIVLSPTASFINGSELFIPRSDNDYISVISTSVDNNATVSDGSYAVTAYVTNAVYQTNITGVASFMFGRTLPVTGACLASMYISSTVMFKDLSQEFECTLPGSHTANDGLDNDCDGLIDEETDCYTGYGVVKADADRDGGFGEDCQSETIGSPVYPLPESPVCYINTSSPGCWRVCEQCLCSWVANLKHYEQLTKQEQMAYNLNITTGLVTNLTVAKDTLSSEVAKDGSAGDERQTSKNIGYIGYLILGICFAMFVGFDLVNLVSYIRRMYAIPK